MAEVLHYSKAPITEATIEIRVAPRDEFDLQQLGSFQDLLDEFPEKQPLVLNEFRVAPETPSAHSQQIGFRFISADKHEIIQARLDGYAYSMLAPYDRWETFADKARSFWNLYRNYTRPAGIARLGVRYINRLDIPVPSIELKDYLKTVPEIADGLPQELRQYFMQLVFPMDESSAICIINQGLVPPPVPETVSILLDIDLYRDKDLPTDEEDIWTVFEGLRSHKNHVFNASLTDEAKGLIS